jgi:hypothetical protein
MEKAAHERCSGGHADSKALNANHKETDESFEEGGRTHRSRKPGARGWVGCESSSLSVEVEVVRVFFLAECQVFFFVPRRRPSKAPPPVIFCFHSLGGVLSEGEKREARESSSAFARSRARKEGSSLSPSSSSERLLHFDKGVSSLRAAAPERTRSARRREQGSIYLTLRSTLKKKEETESLPSFLPRGLTPLPLFFFRRGR